jgi:hypothetical protein
MTVTSQEKYSIVTSTRISCSELDTVETRVEVSAC